MADAPRPIDRLRHLRLALKRRSREVLHRRGLRHAPAYVMEYPKSGGSWLRRMVFDLVRMDAEAQGREPRPVLRDHWRYSPHLSPVIYVLRDGRDAAVSLYFYHVRELGFGGVQRALVDEYFREILGPDYDLEDVRGNLPRFIASLETRPFGGLLRASGNRRLLPWPAHVRDWADRPGVLTVRYEDLLENCPREMGRVAEHIGIPATEAELAALVERFSFQAMSGRQPGEEDRSSHQRKGIAGDWRNHFSREAGEVFLAYGGAELVALGYEADDAWVDSLR